MKKIISLFFVLIVPLTFSACSYTDYKNNTNNQINEDILQDGYNSGSSNESTPLDGDYKNDTSTQVNEDILQDGYSNSGTSDESAPLWCAYRINRSFNEADSYEFQLSFGTNITNGWENCNKIQVLIENENGEKSVFEELRADEFFTDKYCVKISYTYKYFQESNNTYEEIEKTIFDFAYTQTYQIPNEICNNSSGRLEMYILAYAQDNIIGRGFQSLFYYKSNERINFQTYQEYYSSRQ